MLYRLHSQKRHRLAASCGLYRLAASCHQVAASLLTLSSCSKSVRIRLAATYWQLQTCCKLLQQLAASLRISSLDKSVVATCNKSVERINADASCKNQTCCNLIFADLLQVARFWLCIRDNLSLITKINKVTTAKI